MKTDQIPLLLVLVSVVLILSMETDGLKICKDSQYNRLS